MRLNRAQEDAAHRLGQDVCVVAGPGSGKTRVLIERFSWLVRTRGVSPSRILAITFTEKAATEVKQRLVRTFAEEPEIRAQIERAYVSTIHGFCQRLLKENAIAAGLDPEFRVTDEGEKNVMLRACAEMVLDRLYQQRPEELRALMQGLAVTTFFGGDAKDLPASLMEIYAAMRTAGVEVTSARSNRTLQTSAREALLAAAEDALKEPLPRLLTDGQQAMHESLRAWCEAWLRLPHGASREHFALLGEYSINGTRLKRSSAAAAAARTIKETIKPAQQEMAGEYFRAEFDLACDALEQMDAEFRARKRAAGLLDFSDLEEQTIALLRSRADLRRDVQGRFDQILMDELQDTNLLQWDLMNLIRKPGEFFAVGDVNQSIFSFRYAEPKVFHGYRKGLVDQGLVVDELRENYRSRPEILDAVNRIFNAAVPGIDPHTLSAGAEFHPLDSPAVEVIAAFGEDGERVEAEQVAARILEMRRPYRDVAMLVRSYDAMLPFCRALEDAGVPWVVSGGRTFFNTREVIDLICLLKVLVNERDGISLLTVLRSPMVGASDEDLLRMSAAGSLAEGLRQWAGEDRIARFSKLLREVRPYRDSVAADRIIRQFVDASGYEGSIGVRARANIDKFCAMVRGYGSIPLPELIQHLETAEPLAEAPPEDMGDVVRIMTVHQSKGLEFPVVFVPALARQRPFDNDVISFSIETGVGMQWRDPVYRKGISDLPRSQWSQNQRAKQAEEENRLLYVALTRAQETLVMSFVRPEQQRQGWWSLVCAGLGIEMNAPNNRAEVINGVRVLRTEQRPGLPSASFTLLDSASAELLDAPALDEQFDATASATSVSLFHTCPRKYYLSRYLGLEQEQRTSIVEEVEEDFPRLELDASEFGQQVHALLAGQLVEDTLPESTELADRFHNSELGRRAVNAQRAEREWDFLFAIEGVVLRGQIDLWFEHKNEIVIVDYKTDAVQAPLLRERATAYELQLQIYALALERHLGRPVDRAYLHFLKPNEVLEVDLSPLQLNAAKEAVREFRDAQNAMSYPLREGSHCFRCEFHRGLCPAWVRAAGA